MTRPPWRECVEWIRCGPRIDSGETQYLREGKGRGNREGVHSRRSVNTDYRRQGNDTFTNRGNVRVSEKSINLSFEFGNVEITNDFGKMVWTSQDAASKRVKIVFCFISFCFCFR